MHSRPSLLECDGPLQTHQLRHLLHFISGHRYCTGLGSLVHAGLFHLEAPKIFNPKNLN